MKKFLDIFMSVVMLVVVFYVSFFAISTKGTEEAGPVTIYIDAGHGGIDPGKVSSKGIQEKDINLAISALLKEKFEQNGYRVVMTREDDHGLYEDTDINKKASDMKKRCELVKDGKAVMISIHQNSFSDSSVKGAQVFYYSHSNDGKKLAQNVQSAIKEKADPDNTRKVKANDSYYLLLHTACPTIIVECGFLSNEEEARMLMTEEYQQKICEAICDGTIKYIETGTK